MISVKAILIQKPMATSGQVFGRFGRLLWCLWPKNRPKPNFEKDTEMGLK